MTRDAAANCFRALYKAHYPDVLAYALRRSTTHAEAEDAAADVFLVLWRRIDEIPADESEVLPWLYGVSRRVLSNRYRGRERQRRLEERLREVVRLGSPVEGISDAHAEINAAVQALLTLPEKDREVILLAAWESLSTSEIAIVLGCSANAAAIRLHRARVKLTDVYSKENAMIGHRRTGSTSLRPEEAPDE
jgi:RNA polymerase sigma factor (sigma-70 family)